MRILILTQWFDPEPCLKGLRFAKALQRRGHEIQVLTGFPNYPGGTIYPGYRVSAWKRECVDGIAIVRAPLYPSHSRSAFGRAVNYLSFAGSTLAVAPILSFQPDVVYVYNLPTLQFVSRAIRALRGPKIVLDVQDLWPESLSSSGFVRNRILQWFASAMSLQAYQSADRITVLSPGFKRCLISRGVLPERIDVVYNWCEEFERAPSQLQMEQIRRKYRFTGRYNVLFAGTMGSVQALGTVIDAARRLNAIQPEILFTFLGDGVELARLKALSSDLENIQFLDRMPRVEADSICRAADALLVHLKDDPVFAITVPSKTQACLYAGKPILMGVAGDAADLVREADAGVCFRPESAHEMVAATLKLARMTAVQREQMGARGRTFYERHLSFHRGVEQYERIFLEEASQKGTSSSCVVH